MFGLKSGGDGRYQLSVASLIRKAVGSVEARIWHVSERAILTKRQRAVRRVGRLDRNDRIGIRIGIVAKNAWCADIELHAFIGRVRVVARDRRVVHDVPPHPR